MSDMQALMAACGQRGRAAAAELAHAPASAKTAALLAAGAAIRAHISAILAANALDMQAAREKGISAAMLDRLFLSEARVVAIAEAVEMIAHLPDPVGAEIAAWTRPNGLRIRRVRTPLGLIGVIYESRPNVTADAGALCLKAGNAVLLRGGSESVHSARALHECLIAGLRAAGLPEAAIQLAPTTDRAFVGAMLTASQWLDVIVPRGGKALVARVQAEARVPVFAHLEGICHSFVHASADLDMARRVVLNAKMRRTSVCGATECLLVDAACAATHLAPLVRDLLAAGCEVRGDAATQAVDSRVIAATEADYGHEFGDAIIAVRVVAGVEGAIDHINRYSSHHTEAILAEDPQAVAQFFARIDSAILLHNASTQFADGGEFGMGAEIGIATGKLHARGPVGVEQLTSFKYLVEGQGTIRP